MPSDIEIAQSCSLKSIDEIAGKLGLTADQWEPYGRAMAKVNADALKERPADSKLILVTAINPTAAGEGKTTVSIGLADALNLEGIKTCLALREPSLGPVFGMKGGAAGGGYAQVLPMEDINLHFTGDFHAITAANNLIAAMLDNSIQQGNPLSIDPRRISFRRCLDMNDRALRHLVVGLGGKPNGVPREEGFDITTASELMAVFCLAEDLSDLKRRIANIVVARTYDDQPVTAGDLHAEGAAAALLTKAVQPNLVQTIGGTPAFIHGGPFANITHGCNSVRATKTALRVADAVVTEAGFGADLGAEKFIDIKCRLAGFAPDAVVLVATVRALRCHGGQKKENLKQHDMDALRNGLGNLRRHLRNIREVWRLPAVVALNRFTEDTEEEIVLIRDTCRELGAHFAPCEVWAHGGEGGRLLAREVLTAMKEGNADFSFTYPDDLSLADKIRTVAKKIYGAEHVAFAAAAEKELAKLQSEGCGNLPVCIAKTQYSLTDDPAKVGAPEDFILTVRQVRLSAGAGFAVALTGDIMTMPGLPKHPAAMDIDVDADGKITGLF